jgi:signal peptidase I
MIESAKCELAAEIAHQFGEIRLRIAGCSMLPALRPGDIVVVSRPGLAGLKPGHILQVVLNGRLVCHRLIRREGDLFVTQGDAAPHPDPPITEDQVLGRVTSVLRGGRLVNPTLTLPRRVAGNILRRSGFSARVLWQLRRKAWAA